MRPDRRALVSTGFATLALVVALGAHPVSTREIVAGYVLVIAAIALLHLTRVARGGEEWLRTYSDLERALAARTGRRTRPAELVRIERDLTLGTASAAHFYGRLQPILGEAAAARLAARREIDVERQPDRARELLGDDVWESVRPDCPPPPDPSAPGIPLRDVRRVVDALESL